MQDLGLRREPVTSNSYCKKSGKKDGGNPGSSGADFPGMVQLPPLRTQELPGMEPGPDPSRGRSHLCVNALVRAEGASPPTLRQGAAAGDGCDANGLQPGMGKV